VFTGDALSHVAFTGALVALALGLDERLGLFAVTIGVGIALGALGQASRSAPSPPAATLSPCSAAVTSKALHHLG
jgi:ABC-type Mn2+/Zn2+ transport system permease subunit